MTKTATTRYDVAELLRTPAEAAAYLEACVEEADGDAALIIAALGDVARAKGMTLIAQELGISRDSLYEAIQNDATLDMRLVSDIIAAHQPGQDAGAAQN